MIVFKYTLLFSILGILFSCGQGLEIRNQVTDSTNKDSTDACHFERHLADPKTSELAKEIFNDKNWDLNDDNVLNFMDSLTAKNKESSLFYFKVVTNSYKKADGYYAEGLGAFGKEFVENNTKEFISYFDNTKCFTDQDIITWADIVMLEFSLLADNQYENSLMTNYINQLNKNCRDCSEKQKAILTRFSQALEQRWVDLLKDIDD